MEDHYALSHKVVIYTGTVVPRREYDLIEFYKKVKQDPRFAKIIGVEFDEERHMVLFHVIPREVKSMEGTEETTEEKEEEGEETKEEE